MSERVQEFPDPVIDRRGRAYGAQVVGDVRLDGMWEGRITFSPLEAGEPISTARETLQSDLGDLQYWAAGLTHAYLEGALERAQDGLRLESRGEWREPPSGQRARFEISCADDRVPAELLGTFTLQPGVSRDLPDGSRLTYEGTAYRGEDGSERVHSFELRYARGRGAADRWLRERLAPSGVEPHFPDGR